MRHAVIWTRVHSGLGVPCDLGCLVGSGAVVEWRDAVHNLTGVGCGQSKGGGLGTLALHQTASGWAACVGRWMDGACEPWLHLGWAAGSRSAEWWGPCCGCDGYNE